MEISAELKDKWVEIKFKDNGLGIKKEIIPNLFRIDIKTQQAGTAGEKGTGLGLILCKEYIKKLGGGITVESEDGKGTTVAVSLPA